MLPQTAILWNSEAMAASKQPRMSHDLGIELSDFKYLNTYIAMLPRQPIWEVLARVNMSAPLRLISAVWARFDICANWPQIWAVWVGANISPPRGNAASVRIIL